MLQKLDTRAKDALAMQDNFRKLADSIRLFQKNVESHLAGAMRPLVDEEEEINQRLHELHAKIHQ